MIVSKNETMAEAPDKTPKVHSCVEEDPVTVGVDTATHTHRYVPVQGPRGPFLGLFYTKKVDIAHRIKNRGQFLEKQNEDVGE